MVSESSLNPLISRQSGCGSCDELIASEDLDDNRPRTQFPGRQRTNNASRRQKRLKILKHILFIGSALTCILAACLLPLLLGARRIPREISEGSFFLHATKKGPVNQKCFISGFFEITFKFGDFSFDVAKLIDIIWDLAVGRGGQLLLAFVSYRLFSNAFLRLIELHPISYELYIALLFNPVEARCIWALLKSFKHLPGVRLRFLLMWLVLAVTHIVSFSTVAGAMTGYVPANVLFIKTGENQFVSFDNFQQHIVFENGSAIGLGDGIHLTPDGKFLNANGTVVHRNIPTKWGSSYTLWDAVAAQACDFSACPYSSNTTERAWWTNVDKLPILTDADEATISRNQDQTFGWPCPSTGQQVVSAKTRCLLSYNNQTLDASALLAPDSTVCLTPNNADTYQWGFSYSLLTILLVLQSVWIFGMYILWLDTHDTTAIVQRKRTMGIHRAAIDLADAISDDLGPRLSAYSEDQLRDEIANLPKDKLLQYRLIDGMEEENTEIRLTSRNVGKRLKGDPRHLAWRSATSGADQTQEHRLSSPFLPYYRSRKASSKAA